MKLRDLERLVRLTVGAESRPTLAAVVDTGTLDAEFSDAVLTLSARAKQPGNKPDDPERWM